MNASNGPRRVFFYNLWHGMEIAGVQRCFQDVWALFSTLCVQEESINGIPFHRERHGEFSEFRRIDCPRRQRCCDWSTSTLYVQCVTGHLSTHSCNPKHAINKIVSLSLSVRALFCYRLEEIVLDSRQRICPYYCHIQNGTLHPSDIKNTRKLTVNNGRFYAHLCMELLNGRFCLFDVFFVQLTALALLWLLCCR